MVKVCGREDKRETDFVCYGMVDHVLTTQRITHIKHVMTEKAMAPHSSTLAWKTHGWRSMVGYSPWGCLESDTTERLHFHALEKEMATHSSVLAWRIPGTGEPGGLPSMGSHRVGHD